jgi:L-threonylcarbamoyladenylate synthase
VNDQIQAAAALIRAGQLVAFPTETVYGLGANALDAAAIARIYEAKGRPASSPLIAHAASLAMARSLVEEWPETAAILASRFWPGPLTLVLRKRSHVPAALTAGLDTVGVRIPAHPLALALIEAAGVPIAAPSANRFTALSPTTAEHVRESLGSRVAMILDGGPTTVGLESTVLSLATREAVLLRPGMIAQADLEALIGPVRRVANIAATAHPSPGLHARHYSPRTPLLLIADGSLPQHGRGAYLWIRRPAPCARSIQMPADAASYARELYATLHELDGEHLDWIAAERPPPDWTAILDRLERASAK